MQPHLIRANLLMEQRRYEMAIEEYRQALAFDPTSAVVHCRLALALLQVDRWNEAMRSADVALNSEPNDPDVYWVRTLLWLNRSQLKEAEETIRKAIALDPTDASYHGLLARVLYERNRYDEALTVADEGLAQEADNDLCLTYRARVLSALGRHEESADVSEMMLQEDPLDAWNHCLRGEELLFKGQPHEARIHFLESLRLSPGNKAAREGFAIALKARSVLYGGILALILWAGRMKSYAVWGALILIFVGLHYGGSLTANSPIGMVGFEIVKAVVVGGFVVVFLANPIFDLILRFDREGRHALSDAERQATNWYMVCFGLAALCGVWAIWSGRPLMPRLLGIASLYLCAAVYQTAMSPPGYVRKRMLWLTIGLGLIVLTMPILAPIALLVAIAFKSSLGGKIVLRYILWAPIAVMMASAFSDSIREWLEKRRPD